MKKIILIIATAMLLGACNQVVTESNAAIEKKVEAVAAVKAAPYTKDVNFTHSVQQERAVVGEPYVIDLSFLGSSKMAMTARLEATPDLAMSSASMYKVAFNESGKSEAQQITVTPRSEGIHFVSIYNEENPQAKPSVIKVIAGNKPVEEYMRKEGTVVTDSDGRAVIEVPAEEG